MCVMRESTRAAIARDLRSTLFADAPDEELCRYHDVTPAQVRSVLTWSLRTQVGDRAELTKLPEDSPLWSEIDADAAVPWEHIVGVVDALAGSGLEDVEFVGSPRYWKRRK